MLSPEELLHFVELDGFRDDWEALGLDVETDLWELQFALMRNPSGGKVVAGTGGLRKLRFSPSKWKRGKSGSIRVGYVHCPDHALVLLLAAYTKNKQEDLSAEHKQALRHYITMTKEYLSHKKLP
jgi:hypothetical protein